MAAGLYGGASGFIKYRFSPLMTCCGHPRCRLSEYVMEPYRLFLPRGKFAVFVKNAL